MPISENSAEQFDRDAWLNFAASLDDLTDLTMSQNLETLYFQLPAYSANARRSLDCLDL